MYMNVYAIWAMFISTNAICIIRTHIRALVWNMGTNEIPLPRPISCIILDDTYALLSHNINFILVYKHLALPPPPPTSVIQALEMPCTVWNNVTNNTSTTLVIYNNNQFPPLSTYPSIGLLSKDPIRSVCIWHSCHFRFC